MELKSKTTDQIRTQLNAEEILPGHAYRRNAGVYELVCYINCLIGADLSGRQDMIDLFADRARTYIDEHVPGPEFEKYYDTVKDYLTSIARD